MTGLSLSWLLPTQPNYIGTHATAVINASNMFGSQSPFLWSKYSDTKEKPTSVRLSFSSYSLLYLSLLYWYGKHLKCLHQCSIKKHGAMLTLQWHCSSCIREILAQMFRIFKSTITSKYKSGPTSNLIHVTQQIIKWLQKRADAHTKIFHAHIALI